MKACPRCGLPQDGEIECQYCGLNFAEKSKRYISEIEQSGSIHKSFIIVLLKAIIIIIGSMVCLGLIVGTNGFAIIAIAPILLICFLILQKQPCEICGRKFRTPLSGPHGFSKVTGKLYSNFKEAKKAEGFKESKEISLRVGYGKYLSIVWLPVCQNCYENKAKLPDDLKTKELPFEFSDKNELPSELSDNNESQSTRHIPSNVRREVWRRDQGRCVKCESRDKLEFDHIIPVSKGGSNTARNVELLCQDCNRRKSNKIK